jgi:RNA-directed DNA polymerase
VYAAPHEGPTALSVLPDDAVICFELEEDARRVLEVLPKRLLKFGLEMHPEKTKLIRFDKPRNEGGLKRGERPETFDFLGFTHHWGISRKGNLVIVRKTAKDRMSKVLAKMADLCRSVMHWKIEEQHKELSRKLKGYYGYYGVTGNYRSLGKFVHQVERICRKWLERRSRKRNLNWTKMRNTLKLFPLPRPRIVHSYAEQTHTLRNRMR